MRGFSATIRQSYSLQCQNVCFSYIFTYYLTIIPSSNIIATVTIYEYHETHVGSPDFGPDDLYFRRYFDVEQKLFYVRIFFLYMDHV